MKLRNMGLNQTGWQNPVLPPQELTIGALLPALARALPEKPAVRGRGEVAYTFRQLEEFSRRWAGFLQGQGLQKGAIVLLDLPVGPESLLAFLALARMGAVALPLHPLLRPAEVERVIVITKPVAVIGHHSHRVNLPSFDGLESAPADLTGQSEMPVPTTADLALIRLTSGTTNSPKLIALTHGHLARRFSCPGWHYRADQVYGCPLPNMLPIYQVLTALAAGGTVVFQPAVTAGQVERFIAAEGITYFWGIPAIYRQIARNKRAFKPGASFALQAASSSGSYLEPEVAAAVRARWGVPLFQLYGQSELGFYTEAMPGTPLNSVGPAVPGVRLRICDPAGQQLNPGISGQIEVAVDPPFGGYRSGEPSPVRKDGWFVTGDLGHLDQTGQLFLEGRANELIHTAAGKINPQEIITFLEAIPGVSEAHVFAVPHQIKGEVMVAAVAGTAAVNAQLIRHYCRQEFPSYKRPARLYLLETLPRNSLGKVDLPQLKALIHKNQGG